MSRPLRVSHSSIQDFLRCPRRWYLRWVLRIDAVGGTARPLDFGRAFHAGQEAWWTSEGDVQSRLLAAHAAFAAAGASLSWEDRVLGPELLTGYAARYGDEGLRAVSLPVAERKVVLPVLSPEGEPDPDLEYTVIFDVVTYNADGQTVLVEHKTTTSAIDTVKFWSRFDHSLQLPLQVLAATDCGRAPSELILDAVRAPAMQRLKATPIERREFYKRPTGSAAVGDPKPGTRLRDESREELEHRMRASLLDSPEAYYARRSYTFDEHQLRLARYDLWSVARMMLDVARRGGDSPRNPEGCEKYASMCEYEPVCWRGENIKNEQLYTVRTR